MRTTSYSKPCLTGIDQLDQQVSARELEIPKQDQDQHHMEVTAIEKEGYSASSQN